MAPFSRDEVPPTSWRRQASHPVNSGNPHDALGSPDSSSSTNPTGMRADGTMGSRERQNPLHIGPSIASGGLLSGSGRNYSGRMPDVEYDPTQVLLPKATARVSTHVLSDDEDQTVWPSGVPTAFTITLVISLLTLVVEVVDRAPMASRMVIFEDIICRNHYGLWEGGLGDCKIQPVQNELALVTGWKETFDNIPGLLVAIPYGTLANRIGRGKVLVLSLLGTILCNSWVAIVCLLPRTLPLRAIWLSGLFQLIGGGGLTVNAMGFAIISDACSPKQRTPAFAKIQAAVSLSEFISVPLGSALIAFSPWIPIFGSIAMMAVAALLTFLISLRYDSGHSYRSLPDSEGRNPTLHSPPEKSSRSRLGAINLAEVAPWCDRNVFLVLITCFLCQLGRQFNNVLLLYSSYEFQWSYAKASYLISMSAGINLIVLMTIIPYLTRLFVHRWRQRQSQADKNVTLICGIALVAGSLAIFLAPSPALLVLGQASVAFGIAMTTTARSFITSMVPPRYLTVLSSTVASVTYAGIIAGGPLLAAAFQWGLQAAPFWSGLPFLATAAMFAAATVGVLVARGGHSDLLDR